MSSLRLARDRGPGPRRRAAGARAGGIGRRSARPPGTAGHDLAERTSRGEPLAEVVAEQTAQLPAAYRAVVQAGLRAGRLPAALETVAAAARRIGRKPAGHRAGAVAYPLLVFVIAWGRWPS